MSLHPDQPDYSMPMLGPISKESRREWRSRIDNNGDAATIILARGLYLGKFFPRGCRGFINTIDVYCDNPAGADRDVIIKVSVEPGMGELFTVNLTVAPGAAPGWRTITVERFWNYDSLFVWITSEVQAFTTRMGYDTGAPPDGYDSADEITWTPQLRRYWIRINMVAETAGDVPVSGTINNIEIPSRTSGVIHETLSVLAGVGNEDYHTIYGAGKLTFLSWLLRETVHLNQLRPRLICDGVQVFPYSTTTFQDIDLERIDRALPCPAMTWSKWDIVTEKYALQVKLDFPFRRQLQIGIQNMDAVNPHSALIYGLVELVG